MKHHAKAASVGSISATGSSRGLFGRSFATRGAHSSVTGSGAPTRLSPERLPTAVAVFVLALIALAAAAGQASAATPTATAEPTTLITETTAHLNGSYKTDGDDVYWRFDLSTDRVNWQENLMPAGPANQDGSFGGEISGLEPNTRYFVRVVLYVPALLPGDPFVYSTPSEFVTLTTPGVGAPSVTSIADASDVSISTAKASGVVVRPPGAGAASDLKCNFEYVTDSQFNLDGFDFATLVPCDPENPVTTPGSSAVNKVLTGLKPSTNYHLRLSARNAGGADSKTASSTFTTGPATAPTLGLEAPTDVYFTQAQISGTIDPEGGNVDTNVGPLPISWELQLKKHDGADWGFAESGVIEGAQAESNAPITVSKIVEGLETATEYDFRLKVVYAGLTAPITAPGTFTTLAGPLPKPSVVSTDDATNILYTTAEATGVVKRPDGPAAADAALNTTCQFEYLTEAQFKANQDKSAPAFEGANAVSCEQGPFKTPGEEPAVSAKLTGLVPGTTYHLRLSATNAGGTDTKVAANTFITKAVAKPTLTLDPVTTFTLNTATFTGKIELNAPTPLTPAIEEAFETTWKVSCVPDCPNLTPNDGGTITATDDSDNFSIDTSGLEPSTPYVVVLKGANRGGSATVSQSFETATIPATVKSALGASDGEGGYVLQGVVNPHNSTLTTCKFVYGPNSAEDPEEYPFAVPCSPNPSGRDEVQGFQVSSLGTRYTLSMGGEATVELTDQSSAASVKAALEALAAIGPGGVVEVTRTSGFFVWGYNVSFGGPKAGTNLPALRLQEIGGGESAVSTLVDGGNDRPVTVEGHVTGLTPDANYHSRLVVTNSAGTLVTDDQIFVPTVVAKVACPGNEQLRRENSSLALPECRAYEVVTPKGKEGWGAELLGYDGGERVRFQSGAANIAKSGQNAVFNYYVSARTASGWETIPNLNGPSGSWRDAPTYGNGSFGLITYSADQLSSVWMKRESADDEYLLRGPDGLFTHLGWGGDPSTDRPRFGGASDDLSHVLFYSNVYGLSPWGDGVFEFVGTGNEGPPRRVDVDNSGDPISSCNSSPEFNSRDARVLVVNVAECGSEPSANQLWARIGGTTSINVAASECDRSPGDPGGICNGPVGEFCFGGQFGSGCRFLTFQRATPDGSRVFFTTKQQLVDEDIDDGNDLYACDIPSGIPAPVGDANHCSALTLVSDGAVTSGEVESVGGISRDGTTAMFTATGVLAANEDGLGETAVAGDHNLYIWRADAGHPDGKTIFVAKTGTGENRGTFTPDGRFLVFNTIDELLETDTDDARDLYRYDVEGEELVRASTNVTGVGGNGLGFHVEIRDPSVISDDGRRIVFTSGEALAPVDGNNAPDVYLWTPGRVSLITTGAVGGGGGSAQITGSGQDIYFATSQPLTPADADDLPDVYDARIGGGFSFTSNPCSGEACQSPPTPQPERQSPPDSALPKLGNPTPRKACPKGKVRKHGKCVKKKRQKRHSGSKQGGRKAGNKQGGGK